jgi:hypothetical protein
VALPSACATQAKGIATGGSYKTCTGQGVGPKGVLPCPCPTGSGEDFAALGVFLDDMHTFEELGMGAFPLRAQPARALVLCGDLVLHST